MFYTNNNALVHQYSLGDPSVSTLPSRTADSELTEWVKVQGYEDALFDAIVDLTSLTDSTPFDRKCVEPNSNPLPVVTPERVFQSADSAKMDPTELDPVGKYLHVVFYFMRPSLRVSINAMPIIFRSG